MRYGQRKSLGCPGGVFLLLTGLAWGPATVGAREVIQVGIILPLTGEKAKFEEIEKNSLSICHRAYVLENGRVVLEGSGQDLLNNPHVKEAYLGI